MDSPIKFAFGCFGSFGFGMLLHFVNKVRIMANSQWKYRSRYHKIATVASLYLLSTTLGYCCMLLAMTYSTELFIMVILGLTAGNIVFLFDMPASAASAAADPCCDYLDDSHTNGGGQHHSTDDSSGLSDKLLG